MEKEKVDLVKNTIVSPFSTETEDICLVDISSRCGLYTLCGQFINEEEKEYDLDFFVFHEKFKGKIEEITCPNCLKIIKYIKSLK